MQLIQLFSQQGTTNRKWPALVWALALLAVTALLGAGRAQPARAAVDCATSEWSVGTGVDLDQAIVCFNAKTTADSYTITLWADVNLSASTTAISNGATGVTLLIDGTGWAVNGQNLDGVRPFDVAPNTAVTMQNITLTGGRGADGGALRNRGTLTLNNVTLRNNLATDNGGGLQNNGDLTITNSVIRDNTAAKHGGGIKNFGTLQIFDSTISGNSATFVGGGVSNEFASTVNIERSTISGNQVNFGGGLENNGTMSIAYSTISGNTANDRGGGIVNFNNGVLDVSSSTVSDNYAFGAGGGIYGEGGAFTLRNTIVANSFGQGDCVVDPLATYTDGGYNLIEDASNACGLTNGVNNNIIGQDPSLGALQDNGGPTFTHALLAGSLALNAGSTSAAVDQRGVTRPQGSADDVGAFEAADCTGSSWSAANSGALDAAIACLNAKNNGNTYTITLTQNITLMNSTTAISNSVDGVELLLEGNGFVVDGQDNSGVRPFTIESGADVTIQNITITGGNISGSSGGGIRVAAGGALDLKNSTVSNNRALFGGGIANFGTTSVSNSAIRDNSSEENGGGVYNNDTFTITDSTVESNSTISTFSGGGIYNVAILNVVNSTFTTNQAYNGGGIENQGQATAGNSTFSGNNAQRAGGGLHNDSGALSIYSSTISGNAAFTLGGAGVYSNGGVLDFRNNIMANSVAGGVGGDCILAGGVLDRLRLQSD